LAAKTAILTFWPGKKLLSPSQNALKRVGAVYFYCWGLRGRNKGLVLVIENKLKWQKLAAKIEFSPFCPENKCSPHVKRVSNAWERFIVTAGG